LLAAVRDHYSVAQLLGFTAIVSGVAIVARLAWIFSGIYLPSLSLGVCTNAARPASALVLGWAGMRGTVTLAGALSIPLFLPDGAPFPGRDIVIFLAFSVIAVTLLLQGTTLEHLIRRLGLREDQSRAQEDRLARIAAVKAGLKALRALETAATTPDHSAALAQVVSEYEHRLAVLDAESETRRSARRRRKAGHGYRTAALVAERTVIDELWRSGKIADEVHRPLQQLLDHEESLLRDAPLPPEE
jgi:CPA1 family monovalent cation:H+ antiporter